VREEISYQLVEKYGFPLAEVARQPGVTTSAISRWKWRGAIGRPRKEWETLWTMLNCCVKVEICRKSL